MRIDREQATTMRQSGSTYSDIKSKLGVPLATLSTWFKDQKWSNDIAIEHVKKASTAATMRLVVLGAVKTNRLKKIYEEARQDAFVDFHELKYHPLFMAGVMIYHSHGDKTSPHRVSLLNMNEDTIKIFAMFLRDICGVGKIRAQLYIGHDYGREEEMKVHWIERCGLKSEYFIKSVKIKSKKQANKPYFGVCNLMVNSAYLKNKISKWMELMMKEIGEGKYITESQ
jgi:hypothetical protein